MSNKTYPVIIVVELLDGRFSMKFTWKKLFVLLFLFIGFALIGSISANAKVKDKGLSYEEAMKIVEKANEDIEKEIEKAIEKELKFQNHPQYEKKLDQIVADLLSKTEKIAEKAKDQLKKYGYEVEFEYIEVVIGNRVVYVDPIRVHRW